MWIRVGIKSVGITAVIMFLIYRSMWAIIIFPVVWIFQIHIERQKEKEERGIKLEEEFLQGINVLNSALQAGLSMENAWKEVEKETRALYGISSEFYRAIKEINQKVAHNSPIEKLFFEYAYKTQNEDMIQFAELMEYGKRSGSNWKKIMEGTVFQMMERQDVRKQIEVMTAEKRMEQKVMNIIPIGLLAFLQISAWDYMSVLYHNWFGIVVMTLFLIGYIVAILIAQKIMKVDL